MTFAAMQPYDLIFRQYPAAAAEADGKTDGPPDGAARPPDPVRAVAGTRQCGDFRLSRAGARPGTAFCARRLGHLGRSNEAHRSHSPLPRRCPSPPPSLDCRDDGTPDSRLLRIPPTATAVAGRVAALRAKLEQENLSGFVIPRADRHQNEYVAPCDERLAWLTGFSGSAGLRDRTGGQGRIVRRRPLHAAGRGADRHRCIRGRADRRHHTGSVADGEPALRRTRSVSIRGCTRRKALSASPKHAKA